MSRHAPMVVVVARALCKIDSQASKIDDERNWREYSALFLHDAQAALDAAGVSELLELLQRYVHQDETAADTDNNLYRKSKALIEKLGVQS